MSIGEIRVQESQQHVRGESILTISPLHGYIFPNYKTVYINFSHLENNWLF